MSNSSLKVINNEPWYQEGLCFECTGCGKCCSGAPGYVWVDEEEMERLAQFLKISKKKLQREYLIQVGGRYSIRDLKEFNHSCVFLKDNQCSVYEARPSQCKNYPFWPSIMSSKESWESESRACEGIRKEHPKISKTEIEKKMGVTLA